MLGSWGPATAAAFARHDGAPDPEILAAAQSLDAATMADPLARSGQEIEFWAGRIEAELRAVATIDDYRRMDDSSAEPLTAEQRDRFRRALHLVETGAPVPEPFLAKCRADCLDMAGHAAAGLHRASAALLMTLRAAPQPALVPASTPAPAALPAELLPSAAA